jgi:hypothetical protein
MSGAAVVVVEDGGTVVDEVPTELDVVEAMVVVDGVSAGSSTTC